MREKRIEDFTNELMSKTPVPGGGGATALVGAFVFALSGMVTNFTIGKKKYEEFQEDLLRIRKEAEALKEEFLTLISEDAKAYEAVSAVYGIKTSSEEEKTEKERRLDEALKFAANPPLRMLSGLVKAVPLLFALRTEGSKLLQSDVGTAAALLHGAIDASLMNIYVNTKLMKDREAAEAINQEAEALLFLEGGQAKEVYEAVLKELKEKTGEIG